ncbi:MAG: XRE family aerobic/anaerobic benzoate catabolism transcriptional regulator [Planctomycetota bacterium]|jgi:XRE family aerobic/anaerobic benzoate catabolism transcriptional regulator
MNENWFLSELGRRIRRHRERRRLSLSELAERSELSRRYLTETEAGRANPSVIKLAGIARALRIGLGELCDLPLEDRRGRRIALVGLDSDFHLQVGRKLALDLERPFVELERRIEERAPRSASQPAGLSEERLALEDYLVRDGESILVTGAHLFGQSQTWNRLLESCFTVWIRVDFETHWSRVVAMRHTQNGRSAPRDKVQLRDAAAAREPSYSRSHLTVDASDYDVESIVEMIVSAAI